MGADLRAFLRDEAAMNRNGLAHTRLPSLRSIQRDILVAIARGERLDAVTDQLCRRIERIAPELICSILRVDENGCLRHLASPSLPAAYCEAIDGLPIGPMKGSCGTAAFLGRPVEVTDIAADPLWKDYRDLALPLGLRACWSSPIMARDQRAIGTFAFYFRTPRGASAFERQVVAMSVHLCAIAIEQWQTHETIRELAFTDPLTHLGNRTVLKERLPGIFNVALGSKRVALFYLDLDGFKAVNDLYGHPRGDELLCRIARRLSEIVPDADLIVRLGGDEFLIVVSLVPADRHELLAEKLVMGVSGHYRLDDGLNAAVGVSIGVACFPDDGSDVDVLIAHADAALYRAKRKGRSRYAVFDISMECEQRDRRALELDISLARSAGQLSLVYQPIADTLFQDVKGFEALLRWRHPARGNVAPQAFIAAAESCGAICDIGAFALREACREASTWSVPLRIGVNVSPAQIVSADFVGLVESVLSETGLDPRRLEIEVTENLFIHDAEQALQCLGHLHDIGATVAIDDFGTGFSSLRTLRSFPFDRIKIDRSFARGLATNRNDVAIVKSILALGRAMGLRVVAEGVETDEQHTLLRQFGCDCVQGYLIGKPLTIDAYESVVGREHTPEIKKRQAVS
jgi:diguanylate cyclase (GGDEF)-like protein